MNNKAIVLCKTEFEEIRSNLTRFDSELKRLLAPPLIYGTVLTVDTNPFDKDGVQKVVIVYDGQRFEVYASHGMDLKTSETVMVDLGTKRVCTTASSNSR